MRLLHVVMFSNKLTWLAQTKVTTLKTQPHAVYACWKRLSQLSFKLTNASLRCVVEIDEFPVVTNRIVSDVLWAFENVTFRTLEINIVQLKEKYICLGCNRLRPCSKAKDCQLYNDEVTQSRNKTLKTFWRFCLHIYCRFFRIKIIKQKLKAAGFQNTCFFFNVLQVTPSLKALGVLINRSS
jgi:hypothetical protein